MQHASTFTSYSVTFRARESGWKTAVGQVAREIRKMNNREKKWNSREKRKREYM